MLTPPPLLPHQPDLSLLESFRYINSVPGKDVRGKLIDCFQLWFRVDSATVLDAIKDVVGDLHNASLLIDDIEDNSKLRRGLPVAHNIFGVPAVINTANYVYFLALEKCHVLSLKCPSAMDVYVGELLNLHRGQGHDIAWRDNFQCPTEDEYLKMICDKTGGLFRLAVGLMQCFATTHKKCPPSDKIEEESNNDNNEGGSDFTQLVNNLAMYFQIRDDFINLADEEYFKSKSYCEDLTEGKFSFPIIHCIRKAERDGNNDTRLLSILKQRTEDVDVKKYAISLMKDAGSLTYTREKCRSLKAEIIRDVQVFGGNPPLLQLLELLDVKIEKIRLSDDTKE